MEDFLYHENRFATIKNNYPEKATEFLELANEGMKQRWNRIQALKALWHFHYPSLHGNLFGGGSLFLIFGWAGVLL